MRILHVYKDVFPTANGGIERHIDMLRRNVPVADVLVGSRSRRTLVRPVAGGLEVAAREFGRPLSAPLAPTFPAWVRRLRADLVHVHMPNPTGEVATLLAAGRTPVVASYHADIMRQTAVLPAYLPVLRLCLRRTARIVCGTEGIARSSPMLRGFEDKIEVIPYSVDTDRFSPSRAARDEVEELRRRLGTPLVVAVGRLVYYKGFDRLVAVSSRIRGALAIVGSGPLEPALRDQTDGETGVTIVGKVSDDDLIVHLASADCFVLPSVGPAESFGIATAEAQAMGVPAVVTDVGTGTTEAIEDGVTGLVVPAGDDDRLVAAINRVLDDSAGRRAMGAAARSRARRRFAVQDVADSHRQVYERVLASHD